MQDRVTIEVTDGVADVRLARGEKLNAIDRAMFDALAEAIATLSDRPDLRAVVLSGKGYISGFHTAAVPLPKNQSRTDMPPVFISG